MRSMHGTLAAAVPAISAAILLLPASAFAQGNLPFERTEQRDDCASYDALRQPFFGETHLHTSFSFDAYTTSVRNDPNAAYAFAKGAPVKLPAASAEAGKPQTRIAKLPRPIDFAAVTDHAELLGPMEICTRSSKNTPGYKRLWCRQMRSGRIKPRNPDSFNPTAVTARWARLPLLQKTTSDPLPLCDKAGVDCDAATISIWEAIQQAAEDAYDRTSDCSFTSFVGYEYTAQPRTANLHRNVIFRNADVPEKPIGAVDTGGPYPTVLWEKLRQQCLDASGNCDVLTIPHNANLAGNGLMFPDPANAAEAAERAFFEPLTELYQHKGASECRYDRLAHKGVETTDPLCTFEQLINDVLGPQRNPPDIEDFPPRNMIRNVLKDGMVLAQHLNGINPFKYGFIGGTDSHNGDPGNTVEQTFQGHAGTLDAPLAAMIGNIRLSPGSLAVVWAEENSRDSIFAAMRRKETYATSGTRPIVRFFGGWGFDDKQLTLCNRPDRVQIGYDQGVPMGGDLPPSPPSGAKPSFLVAALRDQESAKLQRIQIVKGWVDSSGQTHERVYDVVGDQGLSNPLYDRWVCAKESYGEAPNAVDPIKATDKLYSPKGTLPSFDLGYNELCKVWADPHFDPSQPAFYYARVLEEPTCRWSTLACQAAHVNPFASRKVCRVQAAIADFKAAAKGEIAVGDRPFKNCCLTEQNDPFMERTIQERAWTSPVWYTPGG